MKRTTFIFIGIILLVSIFGWFWTEGYGFIENRYIANTPEKVVHRANEGISPLNSVLEIITIEDINGKYKLVFYENKQDGVMVSLLEKKWNRNWRHVATTGEMEVSQQNHTDFYSFSYSFLGMEVPVFWGVVYHDDIETIHINDDEEVRVLPNENITLYYQLQEQPFESGEIKVTGYNKEKEQVAEKVYNKGAK